ncbi:MAG: 3-phosphoshikimate 1-carboxyvinyltransferase [Bdellovibrionales bacterium]
MSIRQKLISSQSETLKGDLSPPGDKSISHRSIMLGGLAEGTTTIHGLLEGEDVLSTVAALRAMGAKIEKDAQNVWRVTGVGSKGLQAPKQILDVGNSGTSARLLMGLVAGNNFSAQFDGDASLRKRPMKRVIKPLSLMGARFESTDYKLPLTVTGAANPTAISYTLPVASAQVKSAILLAGLGADGVTTVIENVPTRDHSENMLRGFGAKISVTKRDDGADIISLTGKPRLVAQNINVPADPSSAAFPLVAALLSPGARVTLRHVGVNPRRTGLLSALRGMGANIDVKNQRVEGGESVADLIVSGSELSGIEVGEAFVPSMIDEYPILSIAAACAKGATRMRGLGELRVKESDRLSLMAQGLTQCGVEAIIEGDDLIVYGTGNPPRGGATVETAMDHRIAMSFLVLGMCTREPVGIDDGSFIATSFPNFVSTMNNLGAKISS